MTVEYAAMVRRLFKLRENVADNRMHAAIGIAGEVGELLEADSRANILEELGDCYFYVEAYYQQLGLAFEPPVVDRFDEPLGLALNNLVVDSASLLDATKKEWVYTRPLDVRAAGHLLSTLHYRLDFIAGLFGFTPEVVRGANTAKLNLRYPEQRYTDTHAQQRIDKEKANG
jgi:hypothetical protein